MYGVPVDLPLQRLVGDYLSQVSIGRDGVHFHFGRGGGTIAVSGRWELRDIDGSLIDQYREPSEREAYRVHAIFNQEVTAFELDPPDSFTLVFASGHQLTAWDDPQYESIIVYPDNIII